MKGIIQRGYMLAVVAIVAMTTVGCEDIAPTAYEPETIVEAFLIVGEPIEGIRVTRSQSVADTFRYRNSAVTDADVKLISDDSVLQLVYRANNGVGEYYLPDTNVHIRPMQHYELVVTMSDGTILRGRTRTPEQIAWIEPPDSLLYYPKDTIGLPAHDSLGLSWTGAPSIDEYLISVTCLDTLGYGIYLTPPTNEPNRRIMRFFEENAPFYDDVTRTGFLQATSTPISWFAFKWFGRQVVTVYAADAAMIDWFKMIHFQNPPSYQPLLGNVEGGLGVVASASVARQEVFVFKNQP